MAEFQEKAASYLEIEGLHKKSKKTNKKSEDRNRRERENDRRARSLPCPNAWYEKYTTFNTKKEIILREVYDLKLLKHPLNVEKQKLPPNADMSKKCAFLNTYGHTTEECVVLKDQLDDLVRAGHLDLYVNRGRERGRSRSRDHRRRSRSQTPLNHQVGQRDNNQANCSGNKVRGIITRRRRKIEIGQKEISPKNHGGRRHRSPTGACFQNPNNIIL
ncbi:hypothetical protein Cni_G10409 [Canna indica]|uniref:Retrotransposon gag domain-containing protein n=1 Tax=Canna indica TaxID=4628 RepID=A0AAQ3K4B7_9LILI|nr:hypothetical protein Cni_G10409 [Canna indica]